MRETMNMFLMNESMIRQRIEKISNLLSMDSKELYDVTIAECYINSNTLCATNSSIYDNYLIDRRILLSIIKDYQSRISHLHFFPILEALKYETNNVILLRLDYIIHSDL